MGRISFSTKSLIFALLAACISFAIAAPAQSLVAGDFVKGELLVKFATDTPEKSVRFANRAIGATVLESLGDLDWQRVRLPDGLSVDDAIEKYKNLENVEYAQPNFYYHLLTTPNDPQFVNGGMYGLTQISAPLAWDLTTGSSSVVVADIDTGLRYTHEDIAANAWVNPGEIPGNGIDDDNDGFVDDIYGADFRYNRSDPADENGHGTHTAGTIGAVGKIDRVQSLNVGPATTLPRRCSSTPITTFG